MLTNCATCKGTRNIVVRVHSGRRKNGRLESKRCPDCIDQYPPKQPDRPAQGAREAAEALQSSSEYEAGYIDGNNGAAHWCRNKLKQWGAHKPDCEYEILDTNGNVIEEPNPGCTCGFSNELSHLSGPAPESAARERELLLKAYGAHCGLIEAINELTECKRGLAMQIQGEILEHRQYFKIEDERELNAALAAVESERNTDDI